jgi:hypothetical protein
MQPSIKHETQKELGPEPSITDGAKQRHVSLYREKL